MHCRKSPLREGTDSMLVQSMESGVCAPPASPSVPPTPPLIARRKRHVMLRAGIPASAAAMRGTGVPRAGIPAGLRRCLDATIVLPVIVAAHICRLLLARQIVLDELAR